MWTILERDTNNIGEYAVLRFPTNGSRPQLVFSLPQQNYAAELDKFVIDGSNVYQMHTTARGVDIIRYSL